MTEMYIRWGTRNQTLGKTLQEIDASDIYFSGSPKWTHEKMSQLVESILCGFPLPPIYVLQDEKGDWEVLDGVQRLTSIMCFLGGGFPLEGLTILPELNGMWKGDIPNSWKRVLLQTNLEFHILDPRTPKEVVEQVKKHLRSS